MLTVRGISLLISAVLLWLTGRVLGVDELHVIAVASVALVALAWLTLRLPGDRIAVHRVLGASRLAFGAATEAELRLRRDGRLPVPAVVISDDAPGPLVEEVPQFAVDRLPPGRPVTVGYRLVGAARGRYRVGPARLRLVDPFGLVRRTRRLTRHDELIVHPAIEPLPDRAGDASPPGRSDGDQHRVLEMGDEFHTMREYVQGDDLRRVHWPSTARQQKLMVRQHELPWRAETTLLVDTRAAAHGPERSGSLETTLSAAASIACHLAAQHHQLRLVTDADRAAPPVIGQRALLDRLAAVTPSDVPNLGGIGELLRTGGGEGTLLACVAPPPGAQAVATAPDTRMLLHAGRRFTQRAALVVHAPGAADRAADLVSLLGNAGWRSAALPAGASLAGVWPALVARRSVAPS